MTTTRRKKLAQLVHETPPPPGRVLGAHEAPPMPFVAMSADTAAKAAAQVAAKIDPGVIADRILRSGWRPAFGWMGVALAGVIVYRIAIGADIPGLEYLAAPLGAVVTAIVARTVEKLQNVAG